MEVYKLLHTIAHQNPSGHIQMSQVPDRHEPDEHGEINFPFLFETLESIGYTGWLGCEYYPRGKLVFHTDDYTQSYNVNFIMLTEMLFLFC